MKNIGAPYDSIHIMRLTASSKGTLIFDEATRDGNGVLRYSRLVGGKREAPKPFGKEINTDGEDGGGCVAPDGKYLSYCPRCKPSYDRMWVDAQVVEDLRLK